jgi:hypothetical protein
MKLLRIHTILAAFLLSAYAPHAAQASGGGELIGNGGGCGEIILRVSINRMNDYSRTYLLHAPEHHRPATQALIDHNPQQNLETRLIFSETKYEACLKSGGIAKSGICVSLHTEDTNIYIDPAKLYDEQGNPTLTKENAIAVISDALMEKIGILNPTRSEISKALQKLSLASWIEMTHPEPELRHLSVLYVRGKDSLTQDLIIANSTQYYKVSDLIKDRDPCQLIGSSLASAVFSAPAWRSRNLITNASFTCKNGRRLNGGVSIRVNQNSSIDIQYLGLD